MEATLIRRLGLIIDLISKLTKEGQNLLKDVLTEPALTKSTALKLETAINRFSRELNEYFRLSTEPSADDISEFSAVQLQGEEVLMDLKIKLETTRTENVERYYYRVLETFPEDLIHEMKMKISDEGIEEMRKQLESIISAREDANRIAQVHSTKEQYTVETLHVQDMQMKSESQPKGNLKRKLPHSNRDRQHSSKNKNYYRKENLSKKWLPKNNKNQQSLIHNNFNRNIPQKRKNEFKSYGDNKRRRLQCVFCDGSHYNDRCNVITTLVERKAKLGDRCHLCFRKGHHKETCRLHKRCFHCKSSGAHNVALCPRLFLKKSESTSTFHASNNRPASVLQTAIANVSKDGSTTNTKCRILLDSGSQRSYVIRKVAQELVLPIEDEDHLSVFTFGTKAPQQFVSPLVKMNLKGKTGDEITIFANVVPMISENVAYLELEDVQDKSMLADDGSLHNRIDILIGIDYYHTVMFTEKVEIKPELYLVNSIFGWILSGQIKSVASNELSVNSYFQSGLEVKLDKPDLPIDTGNVKCLWELEAIGISMNLREWSSNSKYFMNKIPDVCEENIVKLLGLDWSLEDDTLKLRYKNDSQPATKRGVLKIIASIYDPCGYAVPLVLPANLFLQELWKTKAKWDTPLPEETRDKWTEIVNSLDEVKDITVPRKFVKNAEKQEYDLHCFTDASTKAYAAVVYIVNEKDKGFVIGKSRLVPIKDQENLKIPRLELLGALIGSRLLKYVRDNLGLVIKHSYLWTDSKIVIDWYKSEKLLTPFVTRRIEEMKRIGQISIRYVPTHLNPADVATRPTICKDKIEYWLSGPDFVTKEPKNWPTNDVTSFLAREGLSETELQSDPQVETQMKMQVVSLEPNLPVNTGEHKDKERSQTDIGHNLSVIKKLQEEYFPDETNGKETNLSRNLSLFKDVDGILRCKGRMKYANWSFDKRYPILLPKNCDVTHEIIKKTHENNYHVGANHTLSKIRETYWIPHGKSQVQKVIRKCARCIKHSGGPYKLPQTPALPPERVNYSAPFSFTGVDYLGPVVVNNGQGTSKRWICLFTCLAVRAIHLEVVQDLTAEEGLLALRRMIATRGIPVLVTSDNALYFKLMSEVLSQPYCVENKIKWRFIPALTPWFGGFYERIVGLVKQCMKRTLGKHLLKDPELLTVLKEIEAVLNSRPLVSVDTEMEHVLKPADFLTIGKCLTLDTASDSHPVDGTTTKTNLVKGWRRALIILEEFKRMFSNRYLPSLRERYWHSDKEPKVTSKLGPKEGQIVQLKGDSSNREKWQVGKLVKLIKGSDGLCRVAKVRVGNKDFTRSLAHLYPLEIEESVLPESDPEQKVSFQPEPDCSALRCVTPEGTSVEDTPKVVIPEKIQDLTENDMHLPEPLNAFDSMDEDDHIERMEPSDAVDPISADNSEETNNLKDDNRKGHISNELRPRRSAATEALEKLKEWSRDLLSFL